MTLTLYNYRRCPFAMRARMALHVSGVCFDKIDISFKDKPKEMLEFSPKGTVPVLIIAENQQIKVIDESLDIMHYALQKSDPENWLIESSKCHDLISENDGSFKKNLDGYKYDVESRSDFCKEGEVFFNKLEGLLSQNKFLLSNRASIADYAIFPFIRQWHNVEEFFNPENFPLLFKWLTYFLASNIFNEVMKKNSH